MNYYERHIGDYLKDTAHLSLLEHGIYTRLLDVYYTREEPLPAAEVARLIGARSKEEREALQDVLREFFAADQEPPTAWAQSRCEEEIRRFKDKQRKAKASADARWSQTERNANASANAMRTHSEGNAPSNQTPDTRPKEETSNLPVAPARPPAEQPQLSLVEGTSPKAWEPPACPHLKVLALWAEVLAAMPQHLPAQWKGTRADHLRTRWRETAEQERWAEEADGLRYFRNLFAYIRKSAFLTGRAKTIGDKRPFVIELEWLVNPTNWAKVIEGKYHQDAA